MAQIDLKNLRRIDKQRNVVHEKVHAAYTVFEDGGHKYFQFDTYGRIDREYPGKISQSVQLDREAAVYLVNLLTQEFRIK